MSKPLVAASALAALLGGAAFVGVPLPSLRSQSQLQGHNVVSKAWMTDSVNEESTAAVESSGEGSSFLKWLGAGVLAGILMAVSSAPAEASFNAVSKFSPENFTIKKSKVLEPCKNNKKFAKRIKDEIYKIQARQKKYPEGSVVYNRLAVKIDGVKRRQAAYGDRFCGKKDGLPRVIATGEADVRGSVVYPGAMFLYIAGWIGWAGRSYLMRTNDENKELRIDVPLALQCMASGFSWPVAAWQDIVNGDMVVPDDKVHRSFH
jgi:photosystem I subunit III